MTSIIKDLENDLEHVDKEIYSIKHRITNIPEDNKREFRESMRLLSVFRKDKLNLLNVYHNIMQDLTIKRAILEAQRVRQEAETLKLLMEDTDRSEYDERFVDFTKDIMKKSRDNLVNSEDEIIKEAIESIARGEKK